MGKTITMRDREGHAYDIPVDEVPGKIDQGFFVEQASERYDRIASDARDEQFGGVKGAAVAGVTSALGAFTGGATDAGIAALGGGEKLKGYRDAHPIASVGGSIAGTLAPGGAGALATRAGQAVAKGRGVVGAIAGGVVEGVGQGVAQGVSSAAMSADPLTIERIASEITSNAAFGGAIGGVAGGIGKGLEKGLRRGKDAIDEHLANQAKTAAVSDDLAGLDRKALRGLEETERATIEAGRVTQRAELAAEIATERAALKESKLWLATKGSDDAAIRTIGKQSLKADRQLDSLLDNPKHLAENPKSALAALQKQEHALEQLASKSDELRASFDNGIPNTADDILDPDAVVTIKASELKKRGYFEPPGQGDDVVKAEKGRKAIKEGQRDPVRATIDSEGRIEIFDGRNRVAAAIEQDAPLKISFEPGYHGGDSVVLRGTGTGLPGASKGVRAAALDAVPAALERNRAFQARIRELVAEPTSPKLAAIADATDALSIPAAKQGFGSQLAETAMQGSIMHSVAGAIPIPFVGHAVGAWAAKKATDAVFGRMGAAAGEGMKRTSAAIGRFLDVGGKVAPMLPPLATKILARVRYAESDERDLKPENMPKGLPALYKARAAEVRSQVAYDETGKLRMRIEKREAMANRFAAIRAQDPVAADMLETLNARKIEFLADKLPRRPDLGVMQTGPDRWQPSELDMRTWARYAAACEDPGGVEERLADGTITPEDAEAYNAVYPERAAHLKQQIIAQLPTLRASLPYKRRLALSIFTGAPVDAAMTPQIFAVLQASFALEPGSEGGTQAPLAKPAFGSISKTEPTPSQARSA